MKLLKEIVRDDGLDLQGRTFIREAARGIILEQHNLLNPSCYLPKEVDATSEYKESNFDFKAFGSDGMNGFW